MLVGILPIANACNNATTAIEKTNEENYKKAEKDLQAAANMVDVTVNTDIKIATTFPSDITLDNLKISGINPQEYSVLTSGEFNSLALGLSANNDLGTLKITLALISKNYKNLSAVVTRELSGFRKTSDVIQPPKVDPIEKPKPPVVQPTPPEKEPIDKPQPPVVEPTPPNVEPVPEPQPEPVLPPQPPMIIPPFNPSAGIKQANEYPSYVSQYTPVDANTIYKEIWDRTFSIKPGFLEKANDPNSLVVDQGTGWVLDYYKKDNNHYKLFIATNLHIIGNYGNTNTPQLDKELFYNDPSNSQPGGFAIGKSSLPSSFDAIANNSWRDNIEAKGGMTQYYANNEKFAQNGYSTLDNTTYSNAFSNPRVLFAAVDYMDQTTYQQFDKEIKSKWETYKTEEKAKMENQIMADDERAKREALLNQNPEKIPFYTDFGILEMDVDLTKADETLRGWILQAIGAVDSYVARMKNTAKLPNYTSSSATYMPTLDYLSKGRDLSQNNPAYPLGLSNAKNVYVAGYPKNDNGSTYWMQNNPTNRNDSEVTLEYNKRLGIQFGIPNNELFGYATNDAESPIETGNIQIYTQLWNKPVASYYGFDYNIKFSSLYYGASGSLVYNDFGEVVGIYNNVTSNVQFGNLMASARFAPLLQTADINVPNEKVIYGYNLIDNTGFAHQTRSYRSNLKLFYPNGFDGEGNKKTALFPEGF
ncbi:MIP family Ig-specific serine endopeptidase [Mycoplasma sp. BRA285]